MRSDARANADALVDAARRRFADDGAGASLRAVAADAGVGIGTLYRHFPTREHLLEAVYRTAVETLVDRAATLLQEPAGPDVALRRWSEEFLDFLDAKYGMADALKAVLTDDADRLATRRALAGAMATLVDAGAARGTMRTVDPMDLLLALGGIALIAPSGERPDQSARLLDLILTGVLNP